MRVPFLVTGMILCERWNDFWLTGVLMGKRRLGVVTRGKEFRGCYAEICGPYRYKRAFVTLDTLRLNGWARRGLEMLEGAQLAAHMRAWSFFRGSKMPNSTDDLWAEAMDCVCDSLNRTATSANSDDEGPYEIWHGGFLKRQALSLCSRGAISRVDKGVRLKRCGVCSVGFSPQPTPKGEALSLQQVARCDSHPEYRLAGFHAVHGAFFPPLEARGGRGDGRSQCPAVRSTRAGGGCSFVRP